MIKHYCDRCNKEIKEIKAQLLYLDSLKQQQSNELCGECLKDTLDFINKPPVKEKTKK